MTGNLILSLHESATLDRKEEFIKVGIPLPSGQFFDADEIQLLTDTDALLASERRPTAYWADGSIRWCLIGFFITLDKNEHKNIYLRHREEKTEALKHDPILSENADSIEVKTKNFNFDVNKKTFNLLDQISHKNSTLAENGFCRLVTDLNDTLQAMINNVQCKTVNSETGPLYSEIEMTGQFHNGAGPITLNFEVKMDFYYLSDVVKCAVTLHNPERAIHPSGLWDLGDENSLYIQDFSLGFDIKDSTGVQWKAESGHKWNTLESNKLEIYQESSGGENWDSPNHRNKDNYVPLQQKGYSCQVDDKLSTGDRANPQLGLVYEAGRINVRIDKFWQNFPKSISVSDNRVELGLFPARFPDTIELQPGEKKTHRFYLNLGTQAQISGNGETPIYICINKDWIDQCQVFNFPLGNHEDDPIEKIIKEGLYGHDNFFVKREKIDEYGWRNFGDLYADHEADLYEGDEIFVSHYNNQYDAVYGFLRQFLLSGENKWLELADDLANHIVDIDIYHTEKDRDIFNGGAFWHTDHYLEAKTSSHRAYSKLHHYVYEGHAGGGGPSGEHCYTTGLLYHYLLTGSESSKQAVLKLCDWITYVYEGSGTLFDLLISVRNSKQDGLKNIFTGKYWLDRGTAYYINALLNKFFLTREQAALKQAGHILRNTVHPRDDIDSLDLGDVERRWTYMIFLQSVCSYLKTKEELSELDDDFYYARDVLLHYADWMLENEYPFMEKTEVLEFPNHTWTAQDLRKVQVLIYAFIYSNQQSKYIHKATQILQYIDENLSTEPTRTYSRILVILMQNNTPITALDKLKKENSYAPVRSYESLKPPTRLSMMRNLSSNLFQVIRHFSIKKEIIWLDKRTQLISRLSGRG